MKKQLLLQIATSLHEYGYTVYLGVSKAHGFYTDGKRVVAFGCCCSSGVNFYGNYETGLGYSSGWVIAKDQTIITRKQALDYIKSVSPACANFQHLFYTTPQEYLARFSESSGYSEFEPVTLVALD